MNSLVTVIMPIRNESKFIKNGLNSVLSQTYPLKNLEIIIVDGMSNDDTKTIIQSITKDLQNVKVLDNPYLTVPFGFNIGLSESRGEIIIRVDGHCILNEDYIESCVNIINEKKYECVGGAIKNSAQGIIGELINLAQSSVFGVGGVNFRKKIISGKFVDTLAFGAYRRKVFEEIGGYDVELKRNQDDEFNFRLIQNGGKIWLDPNVNSTYYPRSSIIKLFKQYFQYGLYKIRVFQKRRSFSSYRHLVPLSFVFLIVFLSIFSIQLSLLPLITLFIFYFTLAFLFSIVEYISYRKSNNISLIPLIAFMPIIYFTLHLSYGLGNIIGIFKFAFKWNSSELVDLYFDKEKFKSLSHH